MSGEYSLERGTIRLQHLFNNKPKPMGIIWSHYKTCGIQESNDSLGRFHMNYLSHSYNLGSFDIQTVANGYV